MFGVPLLTHQLCDVPENARTPSDDPYLGVEGPCQQFSSAIFTLRLPAQRQRLLKQHQTRHSSTHMPFCIMQISRAHSSIFSHTYPTFLRTPDGRCWSGTAACTCRTTQMQQIKTCHHASP